MKMFFIGVEYGSMRATGRKNSCVMSDMPPLISPPTKFGLYSSKSFGPRIARARIKSRKPGANCSMCCSMCVLASMSEPCGM